MNGNDAIFGWYAESSTPRNGRVAKYTVFLYKDGTLSCDCPGWVFKRKDAERGCKHCDAVKEEAAAMLAEHKSGKKLTVVGEAGSRDVGAGVAIPMKKLSALGARKISF